MKKKLVIISMMISILVVGVYFWYYNSAEPKMENEISNNKEVNKGNIIDENTEYADEDYKITTSSDDTSESVIQEYVIEERNEDTIIDSKESNNTIEKSNNNKDEAGSKKTNENESNINKENIEKKNQDNIEIEEVKPSPKEIEALIVEKYSVLFNKLKVEYEGKLNNMINKAKEEYLSLSEEERNRQKFNLAVKYLKLGKTLESECDEKFYSLLEMMKVELKANNLKTDSANEAEKQYKQEKIERQKTLLEKAL